MDTSNNSLFKNLFFLASLITIVGVISKVTHVNGAEIVLIASFIPTLSYVTIGIYEVNVSNKIDRSEKIMWTVGFIFTNFFAALLYLLNARKRIV